MKIATLQGIPYAFLKMSEEEDCDGAPLHCCILLFPLAVSPQNALFPLFLAGARKYQPQGLRANIDAEIADPRSRYYPFSAVNQTQGELPLLYSPSGECKHRI
jgi:hypothetical protein